MIQLDYSPSSSLPLLLLCLKHSFNPSIFFVPSAFRNGGYVLSIIFVAIILAMSFYATLALSQTKAVMGKEKRRFPEQMTWFETVTYLFRYGKVLPGFSSAIENVIKGTEFSLHICKCAVFVLTTAKLTRDLSIEFYHFDVDAGYFVVAWAIPFTLIAVTSNMRHWTKAMSGIGTGVIVGIFGCIIYLMLQEGYAVTRTEIDAFGELQYLPTSIGVLLYCLSNMSPISNPELMVTEARQYRTLSIGVLFYSALLIAFGLFCYLGLDEMVATSVVCNFQGSLLSWICQGGSIVAAVLFYGNEFSVAMNALQLNFDNWSQLMFFEEWDPSTARAFVNFFGVSFTVAIAMAIPSLEILCALIGIVLVLGFNICIPLLFHIVMIMNTKPYGAKAKIALSSFLLMLASCVFIFSAIHILFQVFTLRRYFKFS